MCGILGILANEHSGCNSRLLSSIVNALYQLSESRGKDSSGLAVLDGKNIHVYKRPISASKFIRSREYKRIIREVIEKSYKITHTTGLIGHSRMVTSGSQERRENNQPVLKDGLIAIHNGIIVNDKELWANNSELNQEYQVDTEILLSLLRKNYKKTKSLLTAARESFRSIKGTASIAVLFTDINALLLATNNGSLYTYEESSLKCKIFASEKYILEQLAKKKFLQDYLTEYSISQIKPGFGEIIDLNTLEVTKISLKSSDESNHSIVKKQRKLIDYSPQNAPLIKNSLGRKKDNIDLLFYDKDSIDKLKRCRKCILPETFPFIEFDDSGVCNYCRDNEKINLKGENALKRIADKYRSKNDNPDCLVMISGGRDSSYALYYIKTVLNMNPIAYTYDWGMVTDLARRNIARICGKLGIEHLLLSADIKKKRENIFRNVTAWLRKPDLGTIPLFMAGDKQYFFYANKLQEQLGLKLIVLSANNFERTHFKTGFCGIPPNLGKKKDITNIQNKLLLAMYYGKNYLRNPFYLNTTMADTLFGFFSFYQITHNYLRIYDYIPWDESKIMAALINECDWEVAPDTKTTWRIGDGTASFYNYIYLTMAGFTENDTFRSNQIRAGYITREEALRKIKEENKPRYQSIKWYLNIIGLGNSFNEVILRINTAPKLYPIS
ncbi:MAG: hypothetical protein ACXAC7_18090 [Candidatus Hodarchaeales archaeon]|jgi:asparagine synthetase B (glutamine-hydrolysing)